MEIANLVAEIRGRNNLGIFLYLLILGWIEALVRVLHDRAVGQLVQGVRVYLNSRVL